MRPGAEQVGSIVTIMQAEERHARALRAFLERRG